MHPSRPVVIVGAGFALASMLLSFVTLPVVGALDGFASDAWPALVGLAPAAAAAVIGDWSQGSRPAVGAAALVIACGALAFAVAKLADAIVAARETAGAALGPGAAVLVGACAVATAGAVLALRRT